MGSHYAPNSIRYKDQIVASVADLQVKHFRTNRNQMVEINYFMQISMSLAVQLCNRYNTKAYFAYLNLLPHPRRQQWRKARAGGGVPNRCSGGGGGMDRCGVGGDVIRCLEEFWQWSGRGAASLLGSDGVPCIWTSCPCAND
jgi:hypothetical protein